MQEVDAGTDDTPWPGPMSTRWLKLSLSVLWMVDFWLDNLLPSDRLVNLPRFMSSYPCFRQTATSQVRLS